MKLIKTMGTATHNSDRGEIYIYRGELLGLWLCISTKFKTKNGNNYDK